VIWACLVFLFSPLFSAYGNELDFFFEQQISDKAILRSKRIKIPGYPHAYNPSLISYENGYLLSFRYTSCFPDDFHGHRKEASFIGLVKLTKKFKVLEETIQLLYIQSHSSKLSLTAEDGRLIQSGDRIFLVFNDLGAQTQRGFAMYLGELVSERGFFSLKGPAKPLQYSNAIPVEKNWTPFFSGEQLYLIYSDQPRVILCANIETGECDPIPCPTPQWQWDLGQIRGGTPAELVDGGLFTFFHSSFPAKTSKGRAYVTGAYLFEKDPPFTVRAISPNPLGQLVDYTDGNSSKIVFPSGIAIESDAIHLAWGKSDSEIWITTYDKKKLLASLVPVAE
jgi:predicted GH43/DUF377 family glycosyl hydrolase